MFRERFLMVRQRVHRHSLFRPPIIESSKREYIKLSPLDSLVSSSSSAAIQGSSQAHPLRTSSVPYKHYAATRQKYGGRARQLQAAPARQKMYHVYWLRFRSQYFCVDLGQYTVTLFDITSSDAFFQPRFSQQRRCSLCS